MSQTVRCTITATGNYVTAVCWVTRNGIHIELDAKGVLLATGDYILQWEFRADPTSTFVATLDALDVQTKKPCTTDKWTIAHGQTHIGSGSDKPAGYKDRVFRAD